MHKAGLGGQLEHLKTELRVDLAQRSEAGQKSENQDAIGAQIPEGRALATKGISLAIADGVSSSEHAQQASQIGITGFLTDYYATPDTWSTEHSGKNVIVALNRYLWGKSQNSVLQGGYLSTFSALVLKGNMGHLFHVGDSRIYRLRDNELEQLTRDHVQPSGRESRYLSRALGADNYIEIESDSFDLREGDLFFLLTDGVYEHVSLADINAEDSAESILQSLFLQATANGSSDNLSAQVCKILRCGEGSQADAIKLLATLPFPPPLEQGQTLDGYTMVSTLHQSERSQVYLVKDTKQNLWAMKTPSLNYSDDFAYIERFVMESWIGKRIQSTSVVSVVEPEKPPTCLYYLMRHVPGPTLETVIARSAPFDILDAVELTAQIVRGLRAFHRKDTLHQDLKPGNVVLSKDGAVLLDFGSCWVAGVAELKTPLQRDKILGTLEYSAPEYRINTRRGDRSDQFSLGVILYEMLTKKHPYGQQYEKAMSAAQFQKLKYRPATQFNPLVPSWLDKALEKSVQLKYESRYSSLSEFLADLKRPNPSWVTPRYVPWAERNPTRFWQLCALISWFVTVLTLLIYVPK